MIVMPAIDLREGACVQLVGGSYEDERVRRSDPVGIAREWVACGYRSLHLVDLDAATGRGGNRDVIRAITEQCGANVQVGGGVADGDAIESLLCDGASRVVVGTRAIQEPSWLRDMARAFPGRLVAAADVRGDRVVTHGWTRETSLTVDDVLRSLARLPVAGVLVTAVHREGRMDGPDVALMSRLSRVSEHPIIAAGGVGSVEDLRSLAGTGVAAVVVGMAFYTGALDAAATAEEFAT